MIQNKKHSDDTESPVVTTEPGNNLFPVFIKLENLRLLIIGGGNVGLEKLQAVLQNSPRTVVKIVSVTIHEKIKELIKEYPNVSAEQRPYTNTDIEGSDLVIAAVNSIVVSEQIRND